MAGLGALRMSKAIPLGCYHAKMSKAATPRGMRWTIRLLSSLLFLLFAWLMSFVLDDIDDRPGPSRTDYSMRHVDDGLVELIEELQEKSNQRGFAVSRQREIQANLRASMQVARDTMEQMAELHRLSLESGISPGEEQGKALSDAQTRFIESQTKFEIANQQIAELNAEVHSLKNELTTNKDLLFEQQRPGNEEWETDWSRHKLKLGGLKLGFVVPFFLFAAWIVARRKDSAFRPIYMALLLAAFWHLGGVMHEHFPAEYFKYIAIAAGIAIVLAFLVRTLKSADKPRPDILHKRRRESYDNGICPECAYPFNESHSDNHSCPSCGVSLFSTCSSCGGGRHSLLPFCINCGDKN